MYPSAAVIALIAAAFAPPAAEARLGGPPIFAAKIERRPNYCLPLGRNVLDESDYLAIKQRSHPFLPREAASQMG